MLRHTFKYDIMIFLADNSMNFSKHFSTLFRLFCPGLWFQMFTDSSLIGKGDFDITFFEENCFISGSKHLKCVTGKYHSTIASSDFIPFRELFLSSALH